MRRTVRSLMGALLAGGIVFGAPARAAEPAVVTGAVEGVEVTEHQGQWELAYGLVYYRVFGKLRNTSDGPRRYVKLAVELLDRDGKVVLSRTTFNQRAEALAEEETPGYVQERSFEERLAATPPLGAGEEDLFRVGLAKDDIPKSPKFRTYRLKIVEAPE